MKLHDAASSVVIEGWRYLPETLIGVSPLARMAEPVTVDGVSPSLGLDATDNETPEVTSPSIRPMRTWAILPSNNSRLASVIVAAMFEPEKE